MSDPFITRDVDGDLIIRTWVGSYVSIWRWRRVLLGHLRFWWHGGDRTSRDR